MMQYLDTKLLVYMPIIFLLYGMSFFLLGVSIAVERFSAATGANRIKQLVTSPIGFLALFGLLHGLFEFMWIFSILHGGISAPLKLLRLLLMALSFYFLCRFSMSSYGEDSGGLGGGSRQRAAGERAGAGYIRKSFSRLPDILLGIWLVLSVVLSAGDFFGEAFFVNAEILTRYVLGLPGALSASIFLAGRRRDVPSNSYRYLAVASAGFAAYAVVTVVAHKGNFYPASVLNYETFYAWTGVPVQVFRSICAIVITFAMLKYFKLSDEFLSIRFKAVLHVVIAVVIPGFLVIVLVCYLIASEMLGAFYQQNRKLTLLAADRAYAFFENAEQEFMRTALFSKFTPGVDAAEIFRSHVSENEEITRVSFFDGKKEILCIERRPESSAIMHKNEDDRLIRKFLADVASGVLQGGFLIEKYDAKTVRLVLPLKRGRIELLLELNKLYDAVSNLRMGRGWHILLLDAKRDIIIPLTREKLGEKEAAEHKAVAPGSDFYSQWTIEKGVRYNVIEEQIAPTKWSVMLEIPANDIVAPVFTIYKGLLFGLLAVYLSAIFIAVVFVTRVTKPINLIVQRVKSIGRGDYMRKLHVKTGDELETLSEEVEDMAGLLAEKKKMEEQIIQTEKIASLGRLVAGVAHEINNPLGIILGYSQVLEREMGPQSRHYEDVKTIEKHTLVCKGIVEDLLKFSRTSGQLNVEVEVDTGIMEAISVSRHFIKDNIRINFEPDAGSPKITGDPSKLRQLYVNLAMNAIDAMKEEGGTLTISRNTRRSEEADLVEIVFADTGSGIKEEDMDKIFDPFFTTKDVGKGTGLGLSVSYGIVKDHNGRIWAESEIGRGTSFHIVFPAVKGNGE